MFAIVRASEGSVQDPFALLLWTCEATVLHDRTSWQRKTTSLTVTGMGWGSFIPFKGEPQWPNSLLLFPPNEGSTMF